MGLRSDRILFSTGSISIIPSGSITVGATASDSIGQIYAISMSGASATSSLLAPENSTGSFFSIKQPDLIKLIYLYNFQIPVQLIFHNRHLFLILDRQFLLLLNMYLNQVLLTLMKTIMRYL